MGALLQPTIENLPAKLGKLIEPDFQGKIAVRDGLKKPVRYRVPDEEMRLAREKATAVAMYQDMRTSKGVTRAEAARRVAMLAGDRLPLLKSAGRGGRSAISARNLDQWLQECGGDTKAVEKLVRNYAMCGRRERDGHPRFWKYWQAWYLTRQQVSIAEARKIAAQECRREGLTDDDIPTLAQVRYWRRKHIDPGVETLARFGEEAFRAGFQYFIDRDWSDVRPGEILFSDHHDLDCPCKVWSEERQKWEPCRPTLTAFMDAKSWYITAWQISAGAGNSDTIMNTLALSILNMGMTTPAYIYTDNGADYLRTGFGKPADFRGNEYSVVDSLGINVVRSLRYRAQAKTIERRFKEVCGWFAKRWGGYLGNRPGTRSEIAQYYWEHPEELPTLEQLCQAFAVWLTEELHQTPVDGKICQARTPVEGWAQREVFSHEWAEEDLYFAFLIPSETRQVDRGPSVRYQNKFYFSQELAKYIARQGGENRVLVYQDRFRDDRIYVRTYDNQVIECLTKPAIKALAMTDEERDKIAEAERLKRHQLRAAYTQIEAMTGGTYKLADPMQRILALRQGDDARIERAGDRRSVKGGSHLYKHYRLVSGDEFEERQTKEERDQVKGLEMHTELEKQLRKQNEQCDGNEWLQLLGDDDRQSEPESELEQLLKQHTTENRGDNKPW